jgi:DNA-binding transcriptional regulator YdaS (Cro superfamily)
MTLDQYMKANSLNEDAMVALIGGVSASGVLKWRRGERIPRPEEMAKIVKATDGLVLPNDFYGIATPAPSEPEAA